MGTLRNEIHIKNVFVQTVQGFKVANQLNVVEDNSTFMKTSGFKSIKGGMY